MASRSGGTGERCVTLYAAHNVRPKLNPLIAPLFLSNSTLPPAVCTLWMTVRPLPARFRLKMPVPLKFDGWDGPRIGRPPLLGEHTESVLADRLGYSPERIAALKAATAI